MTSTNKQGNWGELQLERVAELTGMLKEYRFCYSRKQIQRRGKSYAPTLCKLTLLNGKNIIVDAKAPTKIYIDARIWSR
jgi:DNA recombination protein RmuC